jgi:hypothetical protein
MKLEKFDLEKALNGSKVVTRDGKEVKELTKFESLNNGYPLIGVVDGSIRTWTRQGIFNDLHEGESDADLFIAVEPKSIWVNVYHNQDTIETGANYTTLEAAKRSMHQNMQYIKTIEITDEL